jgi:hypothetical protein
MNKQQPTAQQMKAEEFYQWLKTRCDINLADAGLIAQFIKEIGDAAYCQGFETATMRMKGEIDRLKGEVRSLSFELEGYKPSTHE